MILADVSDIIVNVDVTLYTQITLYGYQTESFDNRGKLHDNVAM